MNRNATPLAAARCWRDIPQEVAPRSMSRAGRHRLTMGFVKWGILVVVLAITAWAGFELFEIWQHNPTKLAAPVKSEPLRTITVNTDGVLDLAWIERTLRLPKGVTLMELNLEKMQGDLLADGQVKSVVLTRRFPDSLVASLQERSPVGRLRAAEASGDAVDLLVARDGVVFRGTNLAESLVTSLPWLDGVTLQRSGSGFVPISGMEVVADLLATAQGYVPRLYRTWRIISLERLPNDGEIVVKTSDAMEIVFGLRDDFFKQVALLDAVLDEERFQPQRRVATINLTFGKSQVPVAFAPAERVQTPQPAGRTGRLGSIPVRPTRPEGEHRDTAERTVRRPLFNFQSLQPRNASRDL